MTPSRSRSTARGQWYRSRPGTTAAVVAAVVAALLGSAPSAWAAGIVVTTTNDENGTGTSCSLREAITAANTDTAFGGCAAGAGADTITFGVNGTFQLTVNPGPDENANAAGDLDVAASVTIDGNGAANTVIDGGNADRVLDVAPNGGPAVNLGLSGLTVRNGKAFSSNFNVGGGIFLNYNVTATITNTTLTSNTAVTSSGGAIENRGSLTLAGVTMTNNTAGALGGAVRTSGALSATNSTFSGNRAESGGALYVNTDSGKNVTVSTSTFGNNGTGPTPGGVSDDGGAVAIDTDGAVSISHSAFVGNSASANGGAVSFKDSATQAAVGTLNLNLDRFAGNTATGLGSGLYAASAATAERNWWRCNSGPAAAPCDRASGTVDTTPWIVLSHTAGPTTVTTGQSATLTASFLKNSDGSANSAADVSVLAGLGVLFDNAVGGTLSNAQSAIGASGTATATFTAGTSPGAGSADAVVDGETVTADLTIEAPADTTPPDTTIESNPSNPSNSSSATFAFSGSDADSGITGYECRLDGGSFAACTSPQTYTGLADGSHTFEVRAVNGATLVDPTPASYTWTVDTTAPGVTIDQAAGQADPTSTGPVHFTAVFDEPVTGFGDAAADVTLSGSAGATAATVTELAPNDGTTYDVAVSGMTGSGAVSASVPAGAASDTAGNGNTASTSTDNTVTFVADSSAPLITPTIVGTLGSNGWYVSDVTVSWSVTDPDSGIIDQTGCGPSSVTSDTNGTTVTCSATSAGGTAHESVTIKRDTTKPSLAPTVSPNPVSLNGSATATPNATDYGSGVASQSCGAVTTTSAGANSVSCTATDNAGNTDSASASYTVVDDAPTLAVAPGGQCLSDSTATGTVNLTVGDGNTGAAGLTLSVVSNSNPALVPASGVVFGGSGADRTLGITAATKKSGTALLVIGVSDGASTTTVTITVIVGTNGNETLSGTGGTDLVFGLAGANTINGLAGIDLLCGGNGTDTLNGGDGADTLGGGRGADVLNGGDGNDTLTGGQGGDRFSGGAGTDRATDFRRSEGDTQDGTVELGAP